jgi:DNA polymerase
VTITQTYRDGELVETVCHGGSENQVIGGSRYDATANTGSYAAKAPEPQKRRDWGNPPKATIDFETRSACSIKDCGSWRYSLDPTTEVMCLAFRLPHWEHGRTALWHPAFPHLGVREANCPELMELKMWVLSGGLVEAHNAWFERGIWTNVMVPRHGWFPIRHEQWRCSAAKCAAYSLPRKLETAVSALRLLVRKDMEGSKVMKKMAKPRKPKVAELKAWAIKRWELVGLKASEIRVSPTMTETGQYHVEVEWGAGEVTAKRAKAGPISPPGSGEGTLPLFWHESVELLERLWEYCRVDVLAEEGLSEALRDLSPLETRVYLMDQAINEHGFQIDGEAVKAALEIVDSIYVDLNRELVEITEGRVQKATQREKMKEWFADNGLILEDTQGATIDGWLARQDLPPKVLRCLQLVRSLGRTSTAKYVAALNWSDPATWRIHGGLLYHGANTGRWSGAGLQPHNFPRGAIKNMELAWEILKTRDVALIEMLYGDVMECLSHALRGLIIPRRGRKFFVADYAAIEARVVFWLAEDEEALNIFRRGECIYCAMGSDIYGRPIVKGVDLDERQLGKQAVLGLGYQMGAPKFVDTCAKYGIHLELDFAKFVVDKYRARFHRVKQMWWDQEKAAIEAVKRRGQTIRCGRVFWRVVEGNGFSVLHCKLPSGRLLSYVDPVVVKRPTPWGDTRDALTFMGVDPYTKKWCRHDTYGGMIVENITQAVARDLMAEAMLRAHEGDTYDVVLSVHDELIAEAVEGEGDVREFEDLMAGLPDWAEGCPVTAEGWSGGRYKK